MHRYFLGLGCNLGSRKENLKRALNLLEEKGIIILKVSSIYESTPYGYLNQPNFYNLVVKVETALEPEELLDVVLSIEKALGRERKIRWGPRTMDIDILLWSGGEYCSERLKIPHYDMHNRLFFLLPLYELEGEMEIQGRSLLKLIKRLLPYQSIDKVDTLER